MAPEDMNDMTTYVNRKLLAEVSAVVLLLTSFCMAGPVRFGTELSMPTYPQGVAVMWQQYLAVEFQLTQPVDHSFIESYLSGVFDSNGQPTSAPYSEPLTMMLSTGLTPGSQILAQRTIIISNQDSGTTHSQLSVFELPFHLDAGTYFYVLSSPSQNWLALPGDAPNLVNQGGYPSAFVVTAPPTIGVGLPSDPLLAPWRTPFPWDTAFYPPGTGVSFQFTDMPIPEPSGLLLAGTALAIVAAASRGIR
jgi:hypothetical protein